jgi:hypothetical protein
MSDNLTPHYINRTDCEHIQVVYAKPSISIADYSQRLIPELQEAVKQPCEQCAQEKAKQLKHKLDQEMRARK